MAAGTSLAADECGPCGETGGARREWLDILTEMRRAVAVPSEDTPAYVQIFDGLVALHRGELGDTLALLGGAPESFRHWFGGTWRQWYAALWAEAAVLAKAIPASAELMVWSDGRPAAPASATDITDKERIMVVSR